MIRLRLVSLILLYLVVQKRSFSQYTEIKEYGFAGKVKSVTTHQYSLIKKSNTDWVPEDTNRYYGYKTIYFNLVGNIDSVINGYDFTNSKTWSSFAYHAKLTNYFDQQGQKKSAILKYKRNTDTTEGANTNTQVYAFEFKSDKEYIERMYEFGSTDLISENHCYLNKDYRDYKSEYKSYAPKDSLSSYFKYLSEFDNNGWLIKSTETDLLTKEVSVTRLEYKKMDAKENPIIVWIYKDKETEPSIIFYKIYEYYQ